MMLFKHLKIAFKDISQRKNRSLLTVLGIILGISSITFLINFGLGFQNQINNNDYLQKNIITIRSGQAIRRDEQGNIKNYNLSQTKGIAAKLTSGDLQIVQNNYSVTKAAPVTVLNDEITNLNGDTFHNGHIIASNQQLLELLNYELQYGSNILDSSRQIVIIGDEVAKELFNNAQPIAHEINIMDQTFTVAGVLKKPNNINPFDWNFNYRRTVLLPFGVLQQINQEQSQPTMIYEIMAQTQTPADATLINDLQTQILNNHQQKEVFSIFKGSEITFFTNRFFQIIRNTVLIIALILLIISGIGLMNAMQASVTERRKEISLRKTMGATNQQIFNHIITESMILSFVGGLMGIIIALIGGVLVEYFTFAQTVVQFDVIFLMLIFSLLLGFIFGSKPAFKATLQTPSLHLNT